MNKTNYKSIFITSGIYTQTKSQNCKSIDVHLHQDDQFINVVLPNNTILVITSDGTVSQFIDDNLIDAHNFIKG